MKSAIFAASHTTSVRPAFHTPLNEGGGGRSDYIESPEGWIILSLMRIGLFQVESRGVDG